MRYKNTKNLIREATEAQQLTMYAKKTEHGISVYPYCVMPFEGNDEILDAAIGCMTRLYKKTFKDNDITTLLFPEAKAFSFREAAKILNKRGLFTRKRHYGVDGEIEVTIQTAYRGESKMYCVGATPKDKKIVGMDDTFSGARTATGHIDAFEQEGYDVPGFLSFYHRGDGLRILRKRYPDKDFGAFARLEIEFINDPEEVARKYHPCNNDIELKERFLNELLTRELIARHGNLPKDELMERFCHEHDFNEPVLTKEELVQQLNSTLRPRITKFFDD